MKLPEKILIKYFAREQKIPLMPGSKGYLNLAGVRIPLLLQQGTGIRVRGIEYIGEIVRSREKGFDIQLTRK